MNDKINQQVTIYKPYQRHELTWLQTWGVMVRNILYFREFIWELFKRDLLAGYRKSFLGITWLFISPILGILSWVFLKRAGLLHPGDVGIPYPAYVLIGTVMWGLFMGLYNAAEKTLADGSEFIMQINYPRETLLIKQVAQYLADFSITLIVTLTVLTFLGILPSWRIVFFPLVILPIFFLSTGLGLFTSMINIVAIDLSRAANLVFGLLMWITPIIYADTVDSSLVVTLVKWNPLTYLICSARDIVLYGRLYSVVGYSVSTVLALGIFLISWRLFYISEEKIIERII